MAVTPGVSPVRMDVNPERLGGGVPLYVGEDRWEFLPAVMCTLASPFPCLNLFGEGCRGCVVRGFARVAGGLLNIF